MAVTEAGKLPYESGWTAIGLWDLNSSYFASHLPQPDDIRRLDPDLLVIHSSTCALDRGGKGHEERTTDFEQRGRDQLQREPMLKNSSR
jgi:hypothetical protein